MRGDLQQTSDARIQWCLWWTQHEMDAQLQNFRICRGDGL